MRALFLLLIPCAAMSQNTTPFWSLNGNTNATLSHKIGTTNNVSLRFTTNNVERLKILSTGQVGIGTSSPTAKFQINSPTGTNAFMAQINGAARFLVHSNGGVSLGGGSTPPANGVFVSGRMGIGTNKPTARMHILATDGTTAFIAETAPPTDEQESDGVHPTGTGIFARAGSVGVIGVGYGGSPNGNYSTGVYGEGDEHGVYGNGYDVGVYGQANTGINVSYGVQGYSENGAGGHFTSASGTGVEAYTEDDNEHAAAFYGSVYSSGMFESSDAKLKQNLSAFSNAIEKIRQLKPSYYQFSNDARLSSLHLPRGYHYGFVAQDIEKVFPAMVKETTKWLGSNDPGKKKVVNGALIRTAEPQSKKESISIKSVNYTELIPILVRGMQEMDSTNRALAEEVRELKAQVRDLLGQRGSSKAWMKQNTPNPFKGSAIVQYFIPQEAKTARVSLNNTNGQMLREWRLNPGAGTLSISSGSLAAGTYTYSLVVDGEIVMSKKLVVVR